MNLTTQKMTSPTLILAILSACKLILQGFGITIPDAELNDFANGICALVTIIGIFMSHEKSPAPQSGDKIPATPGILSNSDGTISTNRTLAP